MGAKREMRVSQDGDVVVLTLLDHEAKTETIINLSGTTARGLGDDLYKAGANADKHGVN